MEEPFLRPARLLRDTPPGLQDLDASDSARRARAMEAMARAYPISSSDPYGVKTLERSRAQTVEGYERLCAKIMQEWGLAAPTRAQVRTSRAEQRNREPNHSDSTARFEAGALYEKFYCARGDMENRIKEQQMDLFADRTSTHWMASNQLRLWWSTFAHLIMSSLQAEVLKGTELESASIGQIRLRLFKIAARLKTSARPILSKRFSAWFTSDSVP
jgi:Transposase DDE domain group 1